MRPEARGDNCSSGGGRVGESRGEVGKVGFFGVGGSNFAYVTLVEGHAYRYTLTRFGLS